MFFLLLLSSKFEVAAAFEHQDLQLHYPLSVLFLKYRIEVNIWLYSLEIYFIIPPKKGK